MNWTFVILCAVVLAAWWAFKRVGLVSPEAAQRHLAAGAVVVDVRSAAEYQRGHLEGAVNVPLDQLESGLPRLAANRQTVVLLHCLSGTRSALARRRVQALGYPNAFNLGSYGRAGQILETSRRRKS